MTFAGWKDSEGEIYPVGSEYLIKGAIPGSGIVLTGVWIEGNEPPATTEPVTTATTAPADTATTTVSTTKPADTTTTPAPTIPPETDVLLGDANRDGVVTIADATAVLQAIGNSDKYALSEQGQINADCCNVGDGITVADAIAIQKLDAKLIEALPEITE
jgi:hypothetical protein